MTYKSWTYDTFPKSETVWLRNMTKSNVDTWMVTAINNDGVVYAGFTNLWSDLLTNFERVLPNGDAVACGTLDTDIPPLTSVSIFNKDNHPPGNPLFKRQGRDTQQQVIQWHDQNVELMGISKPSDFVSYVGLAQYWVWIDDTGTEQPCFTIPS